MNSTAIWTWELRNTDTNAGFYTVQHSTSSSRDSTTFSANLNTSAGVITVPGINLNGRQSKILVTDYKFGYHTILYSSADVLTYGIFDRDVLVLYLEEGQIGQFALNTSAATEFDVHGTSKVTSTSSEGLITFVYTQGLGQTVVEVDGALVYLLEQKTAWKFWAPPTTTNPDVKPDKQIFVLGPYLVRSAYISHGVVHVSGDNENATTIEVYSGNQGIQTIDWNGIRLDAIKTAYGSVTATIPGTEDRVISLPALTNWRSADSLPEKSPTYDDSKWTVCDKNSTLSPVAPLTYPVLFSSDYGYYTGAKVYRGYFDGTEAIAVNITASGGLAFGWNAWLNGVLIGGNVGNTTLPTTNAVLSLPSSALSATNVVTVVVDYHGHDETSTAKGVENPRGILGASLITNSTSAVIFKEWRIQGNAGGSANLDPVRGPMVRDFSFLLKIPQTMCHFNIRRSQANYINQNEGGLYGERLGWHLPSFTPESPQFTTSTPLTGRSKSGIEFYTTSFHLNIDSDLDVPIGITLSAASGTIARVMIWINGYQYGKYIPHIGPQTRFPVPPGVLNNRGKNTLTLSLWAMTDKGAALEGVELFAYGKYQTDFVFNKDWSYLQPGWDEGRLDYA